VTTTPTPQTAVRPDAHPPGATATTPPVAAGPDRALFAVWVFDGDGSPLYPMGQSTRDPAELADQVTRAAVLLESGVGARLDVWHVGAGARDERRHADALLVALTRGQDDDEDGDEDEDERWAS
jgi:hypothetical protein